MRRVPSWWLIPSFALSAACGKPADKAPETPADTAPAAEAAAPSGGPKAIVTVIYKSPKDTAKFEKYYPTHLKMVAANQDQIGFVKADLTRFRPTSTAPSPPSTGRRSCTSPRWTP